MRLSDCIRDVHIYHKISIWSTVARVGIGWATDNQGGVILRSWHMETPWLEIPEDKSGWCSSWRCQMERHGLKRKDWNIEWWLACLMAWVWSSDCGWWYRVNYRLAWGNQELGLSAEIAAPQFRPAKMSAGDATSRVRASWATERLRRALSHSSVYAVSQSCFGHWWNMSIAFDWHVWITSKLSSLRHIKHSWDSLVGHKVELDNYLKLAHFSITNKKWNKIDTSKWNRSN